MIRSPGLKKLPCIEFCSCNLLISLKDILYTTTDFIKPPLTFISFSRTYSLMVYLNTVKPMQQFTFHPEAHYISNLNDEGWQQLILMFYVLKLLIFVFWEKKQTKTSQKK